MSLPTAATIRGLFLPEFTGTAEDTTLDSLIADAESALAEWCLFPPASAGVKPRLEASTYTLYIDGPDPEEPRRLRLGLRPVTGVTSVHDDEDDDWSYDADELVSSSDYVTDGEDGSILLKSSSSHDWGSGLRRIKVVCTAGFDCSAHLVVRRAIGLTVQHWWRTRRSAGVQSASSGGASVSLREERTLPYQATELLTRYRLFEREGLSCPSSTT